MDIDNELLKREIGREEDFSDDRLVDECSHDKRGNADDDDKNRENEWNDREIFDSEAKMWVQKSEEYNEECKIDEVGCKNGGEQGKGEGEAIEGFGLGDALDLRAEPE